MLNAPQYKKGRMGGVFTGRLVSAPSVALKAGYPLCYDMDYGTASAADQGRLFYVEKPSTSNGYYFAGVLARDYPSDHVGDVMLFAPGSICPVWTNQSCTVNATVITAEAGQYRFGAYGLRGAGTAVAMQTIDRSSTAGTVLAWLDNDTGGQSGLIEHVDLTSGGAVTCMVGGTTRFAAQTVASADATFTLADGTWLEQRKAFLCDGTLTTNDFVLTITTPAIIAAVATSGYDVVTMDAAGEGWMGQWIGTGWFGAGKVAA